LLLSLKVFAVVEGFEEAVVEEVAAGGVALPVRPCRGCRFEGFEVAGMLSAWFEGV
jgi:hypothetical protein